MTYCLGILLPTGVLMASDSRSNAGVDQIATVKKLDLFGKPGERAICILSAGNLATTQSVVAEFKQGYGRASGLSDLEQAATMFDAARMIGDKLRYIIERDGEHVRTHGDPNASFLVGGQIAGECPRLFQIYSAGNFIEATPRTQFLQIGETKYGKPILDRALTYESSMAEAVKLTLLSFDATFRSNLSVAPPIDLLCYRKDSFAIDNARKYTDRDPHLAALRQAYGDGLLELVRKLPMAPTA